MKENWKSYLAALRTTDSGLGLDGGGGGCGGGRSNSDTRGGGGVVVVLGVLGRPGLLGSDLVRDGGLRSPPILLS
ncbi:hypothetical protein PG994_012963 [Apiospora phragmitis]|uniref:Uncharacterized protein n=1 Tax=Apiospora phragmitis TaxID=2905665 RepID=A0ABR1T7A4_9PEZI